MTVYVLIILLANGIDVNVMAEVFKTAEVCIKNAEDANRRLIKNNEQVKAFCTSREILKE